MSSAQFRFDLSQLRRRIEGVRERLPAIVVKGMESIAKDALEQRYSSNLKADAQSWDRGGMHGRIARLNAIFIPVTLKRKRRETWPDLMPIYEAMIVRKAGSYMGRRRFGVDETKLRELRRRILARQLKQFTGDDWEIRVSPSYGEVQVTVSKRGKATKADRRAAIRLVKLMEEMFAERASAMLYEALAG